MPGTGLPTAAAVAGALDAVDFPATKEELVSMAEAAPTHEDVLSALRSLPLGEYANLDEVLRSVETADATGASPAQHAAQARTPARPGLAQHQRTTASRQPPAGTTA